MRGINRLLCVFCAGVLAAGLSACSAAAGEAAVPGETAAAPVQSEPASAESTASVTQGSETYRGFVLAATSILTFMCPTVTMAARHMHFCNIARL